MIARRKTRLLIIQGTIPHYRVPIFDRLAMQADLDVTVLHSGKLTKSEGVHYGENRVNCQPLGSFNWQHGAWQIADSYDVIVGMFDIHWLSTIALLMKKHKFRFIWWGIGYGSHRYVNSIRTVLAHASDAVITYSHTGKSQLISHGIAGAKVFVAPNTVAVDHNEFRPEQVHRRHFVFVGSLHSRKQIDHLFHAFALIQHQIPEDTNVLIIGDGPERAHLEALATNLDLAKRIRFYGAITDEHLLIQYFRQALASVSPGQAGLSVLHSFANGVPFVTYRDAISGGEIENIQSGVNGYLVDHSIEQLSCTLRLLATDLSLTDQLGSSAHLWYVTHRTPELMLKGFADAINFVLRPRH